MYKPFQTIAVSVIGVLGFLAFITLLIVSVHRNKQDDLRQLRVRTEACQTLESEAARSACIVAVAS